MRTLTCALPVMLGIVACQPGKAPSEFGTAVSARPHHISFKQHGEMKLSNAESGVEPLILNDELRLSVYVARTDDGWRVQVIEHVVTEEGGRAVAGPLAGKRFRAAGDGRLTLEDGSPLSPELAAVVDGFAPEQRCPLAGKPIKLGVAAQEVVNAVAEYVPSAVVDATFVRVTDDAVVASVSGTSPLVEALPIELSFVGEADFELSSGCLRRLALTGRPRRTSDAGPEVDGAFELLYRKKAER
jgi:hypothetical protein